MFERLTDSARKAMALANTEAQHHNHDCVGTEHILLGLITALSNPGTFIDSVALKAFEALKIRLKDVEKLVKETIKDGIGKSPMGKLPQNTRAKKVIELAIEEARAMNLNYVGIEHLVLGMLRERDGVAGQCLMKCGVKLDEFRAKVCEILNIPVPTFYIRAYQFDMSNKDFRNVLGLADEEANRLNHEYVGTEHLLLGLLKFGTGRGVDVLKSFVNLEKVRLDVERLVKRGPDNVRMKTHPLTPRAIKVLSYALIHADELHHSIIDTDHLLLGLIRENDGVAAQVLMNRGLRLEETENAVLMLRGEKIRIPEKSREIKEAREALYGLPKIEEAPFFSLPVPTTLPDGIVLYLPEVVVEDLKLASQSGRFNEITLALNILRRLHDRFPS